MVHELSSLGSNLSKARILQKQVGSFLNFNGNETACDVNNEAERIDKLMVTSGFVQS